MNARTEPVPAGSDAIARPPLVRELLLVAGLFLVYKFGRQLATGHTGEAFHNAHLVWDLGESRGTVAVRMPARAYRGGSVC